MNIKIRSTNFGLTPPISDYVSKKILSLEKFLDEDVKDTTLCEVEIGKTSNHHKSGDIFKAEVNITAPGHKQIYVVAEEGDLSTAIDIVRDEAERLLISQKKKRGTLLRRGGARIKQLLKMIDIRPKRWR